MKKKLHTTEHSETAGSHTLEPGASFQDMESLRNAYDHLAAELQGSRALLEATSRRYAHILDFAPVGYCMMGSEGQVLRANLTLADMLQTERSLLEAGTFADFIATDAQESFDAYCDKVTRSDGREWCELRLRKNDGSHLDARIDAILMYDLEQKADVMHATVVDLSGQKRIERELLEIQKIGKIASFRWDFAPGVLEWSPEFYAIVERCPQDIPHTFGGCLSLVHPEDRSIVMNAANAAIAGDGEQLIEYRVVMPDGREKWIAMQGQVQFVPKSRKAVCMIGYAQDITDRKLGAAEQFRLQGQLLHAQKMESIGHLAAGVAHDFNNILQTILGYAQLMQERTEEDPVSARYADTILFAVKRASDLTRGLLAFGRKQAMTFDPVDLNEVVRDTSRLIERIVGGDIELTILLSEQCLTIRADATHIQQALVTLAAFARDSMPGGGRIFISTNPVALSGEETLLHDPALAGNYALLSMSDIGVGMNEHERCRIFEPFCANGDADRAIRLGLAGVYGVVKQHGGFVDVASEPGAGTTFRIYIPLGPPVEARAKNLPRPVAPLGHGIILLAEDDLQVRTLLKDVISSLGYEVLLAVDGEEAVRLFSQHKDVVDLVLLDMAMPKLNGREAGEQIRRIKPFVKMLFMSGYASDAPEIKSLLGEGAGFLAKPVSVQQLSEKIRQALGR
jgi:PAS domain S-box-containing protein